MPFSVLFLRTSRPEFEKIPALFIFTRMYRIIILLIFCCFGASCLFGQADVRTFYKSQEVENWGLTVGPVVKITGIMGKSTGFFGSTIDLSTDSRLSFGVSGFIQNTPLNFSRSFGNGSDSSFSASNWMFGISGRFLLFPDSRLRLVFPLFLGGGNSRISVKRVEFDASAGSREYFVPYENSSFVCAEPGASVEFAASHMFHLCIGMAYRITYGTRLDLFTDNELSGLSLNLGIRFGVQ